MSALYQESVVYDRLYFQIIVKLNQPSHLFFIFIPQNGSVYLSRFTGRSHDKAFTVLRKYRFRYPRFFIKIIEMRKRHKLVQILESRSVLCKNYYVICASAFIVYRSVFIYQIPVLKEISLTSVEYLYILSSMGRIRKRLDHTVIRYGDRLMSPFFGSLHHMLDIVKPIHCAHLRMRMQLYTLFRISIFALLFLCLFQAVSHDDSAVVKPVPLRLTPHLYAITGFEMGIYILPFLIYSKCLYTYTGSFICYVKSDELAVCLRRSRIFFEEFSLYNDSSAL